jgi:mannose-6-phosphate isomerase
MANSDNVLRAGLTPKYIDVPELISNTRFQSITPSDIKLKPELIDQGVHFPIPVEDFGFEVLDATCQPQTKKLTSGEILFCIKGNMTVSTSTKALSLTAGESIFIGFDGIKYQFEGNGTFARAFN